MLPDFISREHFEHIYDFMIRLFRYNTILVSNLKMFAYFPVLISSGVASGTAIGIISWLILKGCRGDRMAVNYKMKGILR